MTVLDVPRVCNTLGIDYDAFASAQEKELEFLASVAPDDDQEHFSEYKNFMTHDELVAIIRWNNLHKCYPQYFTWDGAVDNLPSEGGE